MDCGLPCDGNINFPILTVTGTTGTNGADGADGVVVVYDNTPTSAYATKTIGWETFENAAGTTSMSSGAISNISGVGDKLAITAIFRPSSATAVRSTPQEVRISIGGVVVGNASTYSYIFTTGVAKAKFVIKATAISTTSLYLDVTVYTSTTYFDTKIQHFTETIAVADITNISEVLAQGNSAVIADLLCEQLTVEFLNKS
jgi:hypothetical protein